MDFRSIFSYFFGDGPSKWIGWAVGLVGLAVTFGFISKSDGDSIQDKISNFFGSIWSKITGAAQDFFDKEGAIAEKGMLARLEQAGNGFATAERGTGVAGIGDKYKAILSEGVKKGGDPIDNAIEVYGKIHALTIAELKNAHTNWTAADVTRFEAIATQEAIALTGIDTDQKANINVNNIRGGYAGMLLQAQKAKEADGTMTETDVAAMQATPQLQALARGR
jgi:hypothetical protein